jgi:hypothetical protein
MRQVVVYGVRFAHEGSRTQSLTCFSRVAAERLGSGLWIQTAWLLSPKLLITTLIVSPINSMAGTILVQHFFTLNQLFSLDVLLEADWPGQRECIPPGRYRRSGWCQSLLWVAAYECIPLHTPSNTDVLLSVG